MSTFSSHQLTHLRRSRGLTQQGLATSIDVDQATISRWERGSQAPSAENLRSLAKTLNCRPQEFEGNLRFLNDQERSDLLAIATKTVIAAGFAAQRVQIDLEDNASLDDSANPSTVADVEATIDGISAMHASFSSFGRHQNKHIAVFAEELAKEKTASLVVAQLLELGVHSDELITSGDAFSKQLLARICMLLDAIDGTKNYVSRLPQWCSAVAGFDSVFPIVGALYLPTENVVLAAQRAPGSGSGTATYWDVRSSTRVDLKQIVARSLKPDNLSTHLSSKPDVRREFLPKLDAISEDFARVSMWNSGQYSLGMAALGRLSVFCNPSTSVWDVAAGDVILSSLGGFCTTFEGEPIDYTNAASETSVVASLEEDVHANMVAKLRTK